MTLWCDYRATLCWLAEDPIGVVWCSPTKCYADFVGDCTWSTRITVQEQMGIPLYAWIKLRAAVQCRIHGPMSVSIFIGIWLHRVKNFGHAAYAVHQSVLSSKTQQCTTQWGYRVNTEQLKSGHSISFQLFIGYSVSLTQNWLVYQADGVVL